MDDIVSAAFRERLMTTVDRAQLAQMIEDSLDDQDLLDVAQRCGAVAEHASREELVNHLAGACHGGGDVSAEVARSLERATREIVDQVQSIEVSELERTLTEERPSWSATRGQVLVALLADTRPEVNAMLERFFDRQSSSQDVSAKAAEDVVPPKADWVSEELRKELEQARQERAELMSLLKEVRTLVERLNAPPASAPEPRGDRTLPGMRVGLFVDVQHVFYNARNFYGRKLDFKKLVEVTTKDRTLVTAVAYLVLSPDVDQTNFITMLEQNGYGVREKLPRRRNDSLGLTDDELPMALDVLKRAENLDIAVLVGGDIDILTLSQRIQGNRTQVELYGFPQSITDDVLRAVDRFYPIDDSLLLPQDYVPKRPPHDAQHRPANRGAVPRGFVNQQRRGWGPDVRGV